MKSIAKIVCTLGVAALGMMLFTGCAGYSGATNPYGVSHGTLVGDVTYPAMAPRLDTSTQVMLTSADFKILQPVTVETTSTSVLGLFASGDNGYGKLMEKARQIGADDVINIKVDTRSKSFLTIFFKSATTMVTGVAIKYNK